MLARVGGFVLAATAVMAWLLPVSVEARVELLPEPIGCRISATMSNDHGMCRKLYHGVSASDLNTAFPSGRTNPFVIQEAGGTIGFLYETPQTFNSVCFQQPPSVPAQWIEQSYQARIAELQVWAVPAEAIPGDANAPLVAPDFSVSVSLGSELRCYPLQRSTTTQRVIVRLVTSADSQGSAAASTLVLGRDTAWEPSLSTAAVPQPEPAEAMPVDVADVVAIHGVDDCAATSQTSSLGCRGVFDTTPSLSDVNTVYPAGRTSVWGTPASAQAPFSMTLSSLSLVNGLCAQQRGSGYTSAHRTGRIDVWNGFISDVNAASTRAPDATIVLPQASGGELMCYRLLNSNGTAVSFTSADLTFIVRKAVGGLYSHGLATLLPAQLVSPGPSPAPVKPAQLTFFVPRSCSIDFTIDYTTSNNGDNGPPCTTMYSSAISAGDVGTTYNAGAKQRNEWVRVNNGVVRFLFAGMTSTNTVCLKQPSTMTALWGSVVQPVVASLDIWPGNVPAASSWSEPAPAPLTVAVSAGSRLLCYPLPAAITTRNVTVRFSVPSSSQGTPGASSLFFAFDPAWTAPPAEAATQTASTARVDRGLERETLPVPTSMVRALHHAVGCVSPSWPEDRGGCIYAYNTVPPVSDVNTPFTRAIQGGSWTAFLMAGAPLAITLGASSFVNAVCYQQRNVATAPSNVDMAAMIDVWPGQMSESAMLSTAPLATIVIPRSAGRELFCYPLVSPVTMAEVNFTSVDLSLRVWRAPGLRGSQGSATLFPAIVAAEGVAISTPVPTSREPISPPAGPINPTVTPAPATGASRSPNDGGADADAAAVSTTAVVAIVATAVVVIVIVVTVGVVCAIRASSKTNHDDASPTQLVAPTSLPAPVEGRPVAHDDAQHVLEDNSEFCPYPPPDQNGDSNEGHTPSCAQLDEDARPKEI
jgi:hypothetical protein